MIVVCLANLPVMHHARPMTRFVCHKEVTLERRAGATGDGSYQTGQLDEEAWIQVAASCQRRDVATLANSACLSLFVFHLLEFYADSGAIVIGSSSMYLDSLMKLRCLRYCLAGCIHFVPSSPGSMTAELGRPTFTAARDS